MSSSQKCWERGHGDCECAGPVWHHIPKGSLLFRNSVYGLKVKAAEVCSVYCKQSTLLGLL